MRAALFMAVLLTLATVLTVVSVSVAESPQPQYVPHEPICLVGDNDPDWANFPGSGTADDPKVIEGFEIVGTNHCIWLINTTLHVVINNCYLHDGSLPVTCGVRLENASNVSVNNTFIENLQIGIYVVVANNLALQNSNVTGFAFAGISLYNTSNVFIHGILVYSGTTVGVEAAYSYNINVSDTTVSAVTGIGLLIESSDTVELDHVRICDTRGYTGDGFFARNSTYLSIYYANFSNNVGSGVVLQNCSLIGFSYTVVEGNNEHGLYATNCIFLFVANTTADANIRSGFALDSCAICAIGLSNATRNRDGFLLSSSVYCHILNCSSCDNDNRGVAVTSSSSCMLANSSILRNNVGVDIERSSFVEVQRNQIYASQANGTTIIHSNNCTVYDNLFNNTVNCYLYNVTDCAFNTTAYSSGPNIIGGPYVGGNYWSDYTGTDANGDGYGDTPYPLEDAFDGEVLYDYLPLVLPSGAPDTTPPSVTILEPSNGTSINASDVTLHWTASDNVGVDKIEVWLNGSLVASLSGSATEYPLHNLQLGWYNATVVAFDAAGNSGRDTVWFEVTADTSPPFIQILKPEDGAIFNKSTVVVEWTSSDNVRIDHFELSLDNGPWVNIGTQASYSLTELTDGSHEVTVRAFDTSGNVDEDSVSFTIDTTPPTITVLKPDNNSVVSQTSVTVEWSASDAATGVANCWIRLDDADWVEVGAAANQHTFTNLSYGTHCVTIKVVDHAGNVATTRVCFTVAQPAPPTAPTRIPLVVAVIVGIAAALAIAFLLYRRRRVQSALEEGG